MIILVGGGKVGTALARQLSGEDHSVTVIDTNKARVEHLSESYDVMGIVGNGSSITTLSEAGIEEADVFIAVTGSDELNQVLSEKRASRVVNHLQQACGWKPYRMLTPTGMAEADPLADNSTPEGKAQNRRVAVNVLVSKSVDGMQ